MGRLILQINTSFFLTFLKKLQIEKNYFSLKIIKENALKININIMYLLELYKKQLF